MCKTAGGQHYGHGALARLRKIDNTTPIVAVGHMACGQGKQKLRQKSRQTDQPQA
jgi:hypothetical protein